MNLLIHTCCADCLLKLLFSLQRNHLDYSDSEKMVFKLADKQIFLNLKLSQKNANDSVITCYYFNPNIHPRSEYLARLQALKQIFKHDFKVNVLVDKKQNCSNQVNNKHHLDNQDQCSSLNSVLANLSLQIANYRPIEYFHQLQKNRQAEQSQNSSRQSVLNKQNFVSNQELNLNHQINQSSTVLNRCQYCYYLRLKQSFKYAQEQGISAITSTMLASNYMNIEVLQQIGLQLAKKYKIDFVIPKIDYNSVFTGFYKQFYCGCVYSLGERLEQKYLKK